MPARIRSALLTILLGAVFHTPGQTTAQQYKKPAYEHFFAHVICILTEHCFVGNPPTMPPLRQPFQNILLTDREAEALKAIALDYERKNAAFLTVVGPLRSEARFQSIELGQVSEELAKRITSLDSEHDQMVSDEINRLKDAFGSERFEVLNNGIDHFIAVAGRGVEITAKDSR